MDQLRTEKQGCETQNRQYFNGFFYRGDDRCDGTFGKIYKVKREFLKMGLCTDKSSQVERRNNQREERTTAGPPFTQSRGSTISEQMVTSDLN